MSNIIANRNETPFQSIKEACATTGLSQFFLRSGCALSEAGNRILRLRLERRSGGISGHYPGCRRFHLFRAARVELSGQYHSRRAVRESA